jgi:hypothetical protein
MIQVGERENSSVIPSFNRPIRIDFRGACVARSAVVDAHLVKSLSNLRG